MKRVLAFLSLFTSLSTLLCCALPALFVALGFGAAFAGLVANVPQLIWISEYKIWLFSCGAVFLSVGGVLQWWARFEPCPMDPSLARDCMRVRRSSLLLYGVSLVIFLVGAFFAFLAPFLS